MNDFESYKDISSEDLADIFKTFSGMTTPQWQVRLMTAKNNKIKEITQWVKDQFRLRIDPTTPPLP